LTDIYAVVSRPGPVEAAVLAELGPRFTVTRRALSPVTLRVLEGGEGPKVLLLHGRGHAATMWHPLLTRLVASHRVIAVDLPGFGHSSAPPYRGRGPEDAVRFFADPVGDLIEALGIEDAAIVGHSLGALVALALALGHRARRARPHKLVLIGAMGVGPSMGPAARMFFRAVPERLASLLGARLFQGLLAAGGGSPVPPRLAALEVELLSTLGGKRAPAEAFNALFPAFGPQCNVRDRLGELQAETLFVHGEDDPVFPAPEIIAAARAMPRAEAWVLPGRGHSPHLEDADGVGARIEDFLA
jgi:pimeloyl-ACP methyl ester carboxylesterase